MLPQEQDYEESIIAKFQEEYQWTSRGPKKRDYGHISRIEKAFGSWTEGLIEAGFFRKKS